MIKNAGKFLNISDLVQVAVTEKQDHEVKEQQQQLF